MPFSPERKIDPIEGIIAQWPEQFADTLRTVLERLRRGEINIQEAKNQLHGDIDTALSTIAGQEKLEEEPER